MLREVLVALLTIAVAAGLLVVASRISALWARRIWLLSFVLVVNGGITMMSAHAFVAKWGFRGEHPRFALQKLIDGTANRPFVYRRLTPDVVGAIASTVVEHTPRARLEAWLENSTLARYRVDGEPWSLPSGVAFHASYALVWLSLFGTSLASAALVHVIRRGSVFESLLAGAVASALTPLTYMHGGYVYDAPEQLLWTLLLVVLLKDWPWPTLPLFVLMVINKESALLALPAIAVIHWQRRGAGAAVRWTAPLFVLGVLWVAYVRQRYVGNAGSALETRLTTNLEFWLSPKIFFRFAELSAPGLPSPRGLNLLLLALVFLPFRFGWRSTPRPLRWALLATAVLVLPLFLVGSMLDEIRALALLFPLMFVVTVEGAHALVSGSVSAEARLNETDERDRRACGVSAGKVGAVVKRRS